MKKFVEMEKNELLEVLRKISTLGLTSFLGLILAIVIAVRKGFSLFGLAGLIIGYAAASYYLYYWGWNMMAGQTAVSPMREPRTSRPMRPGRGRFRRGSEMFKITCADCKKETEVPFRPHPGRPVYCRECFSKRKTQNR